jgi:hypothetical protein
MDGLLIKTSGIVRAVGADYFTIADGFWKSGAEVRTKVFVGVTPSVASGTFVTVTGIASKNPARLILSLQQQ